MKAALTALALALMLANFAWSQVTEKVLYNFGGSDGSFPYAGLIFDSAGNLYGTTTGGGGDECTYGCGTIFKLTPSNGGWTETVLHSFTGFDGYFPSTGLILDSKGDLYGTTNEGGPNGYGTVFQLTPSNGGWTETILHSFGNVSSDGSNPNASVISDSAGNLYGTTAAGGANGGGVVFELTPSNGAWTETILYNFSSNSSDGSSPFGGLILDSVGNLYGTTSGGGGDECISGCGTVFELKPFNGGWTEAVLHSFAGSDGFYPEAGLIFDSAGNLYGTTYSGGANGAGTVFELAPDSGGWTETILYNFSSNGSDGYSPSWAPIFDSIGNLYGSTNFGGSEGYGTVFELIRSNVVWTESTLYSFTGGRNSLDIQGVSGLVSDKTGSLYGTTVAGGANNDGVIFEIAGVSLGSPAVALTPSYLVFPSAGTTLPLTVTNSGTANLNMTVPQTLSGFNSFDFTVAHGTTCTNSATIAPGDFCIIDVTFNAKPVTASAESATLSIFDNAAGSPQMVPLSGGAALTSISPNPVPGSSTAQTVTVSGNNFLEGAVINWQDLTAGGTGTVTPLSVTPNQLTASMRLTNATAAWQIQVANPSEQPSNWFSFEVLPSQYAYVKDDYPFQNAAFDTSTGGPCAKGTADPYNFCFRECTSYVAWRMNRDAGTTNPKYRFFFDGMGGKGNWSIASNWYSHAKTLRYPFDTTPQVGDIAQWISGCGSTCAGGHVAYVEQVNQTNGVVSSIVVSEYNYPENASISHQFNVRPLRPNTKDPYPQYFIHILKVVLSSNLLNFGNQTVGTSSSQSVTLTNPGTAAVPITSIIVSGANKSDFAETNTCGSSIPAGGSCQLTVTFTPQKAQPFSAIVTVSDVAGPPITQTITLMGSGT